MSTEKNKVNPATINSTPATINSTPATANANQVQLFEGYERPMAITPELANEAAESVNSYLDSLKLTYSSSKQFEDESAKIGDFFVNDSLGNEIDVWIPFYGHQVLALDEDDFKGKIIFSYLESRYDKTEKYKKFMEENGKYDPESGFLFLVYLPKLDKFTQFFMKGTLKHPGAQIINKLIEHNFFRLTASKVEGKKYLKVKVDVIQPFKLPTMNKERLDKAIEMLLAEKSDSSEGGAGGSEVKSGR